MTDEAKPFFSNEEKAKLTRVYEILEGWVTGRNCCGNPETCAEVHDRLAEEEVSIILRINGSDPRQLGRRIL
jgi:hypothetical protein